MRASSFIDFVRNQQASGDGGAAGRLFFLDLESVAIQFGPRWEKVAAKALFLAETVLKGSLSKGDAYTRYADKSFVVLFASLTEAEAGFRLRVVSENICRRLLGESFDPELCSSVMRAAAVDLDGLDIEGSTDPLGCIVAATDEKIRAENAGELTLAARDRTAGGLPHEVAASIEIGFVPLWNARSQTVFGYKLLPRRNYHGRIYTGNDVLMGGAADPYWGALATHMAEAAKERLAAYEQKNTVFFLPLHVQSFAGKDFFTAIRTTLRNPVYSRFLVVELLGVDDTMSGQKLRAIHDGLADLVMGVVVRISPDAEITGYLKELGVKMVGLGFSRILDSGLGRKTGYRILGQFAKECAEMGLGCYVWAADSASDFMAASRAGFDWISGQIVGPATANPTARHELPRERILGV